MIIPDNVEGIDADLQRLSGESAAVDAGIAPVLEGQGEAQAQQAAQDAAGEVAQLTALLQIASGLFVPMFPSIQQIYTLETCASLAGAIVPVMIKRGWTVSSAMAGWGEEIALAVVVLPIALATNTAVRHDIAAAKLKEKIENEKNPEPAAVVYLPVESVNDGTVPVVAARG